MSEHSLQFDSHTLRRTLSTGDIPSRDVPRPQRARISISHRPPTEPIASAAPNLEGAYILPEIQPYRTWYGRTMAFFGYGRRASKARKELVSLIWNLSWGFVQVVFVIILLAFSTHLESPTINGISEWDACDRPLGVWNCLWIARVCLACGLSYWGWCRDRNNRANEGDVESAEAAASPRPSISRSGPRTSTNISVRNAMPSGPNTSGLPESQVAPNAQPFAQLYARLSLLSSLVTLTWFLTAHILEYTSVNSCRNSSPHLWWLTFGILCIMYLMVLEVFILGFVVFIMAPLLFLFWNIVLLCLGRHPVQNPHMIKPEIGKLPRSIVDRIPLVVYIPPPPDDPAGTPKIPEAIHSNAYPPKPRISTPLPKKRFAFLKFKGKKGSKGISKNGDGGKDDKRQMKGDGEPQTWEEHWEQGEYPFVRLEGNRAACAICLMDFEEPKRVSGSLGNDAAEKATEKPVAHDQSVEEGPVQEILIDTIQEEDRETGPKLEDAGEGPQPLRLLTCGHVFHKTCLDPWLVDVSGRCPVCQRPVELPAISRKKRSRGQNR